MWWTAIFDGYRLIPPLLAVCFLAAAGCSPQPMAHFDRIAVESAVAGTTPQGTADMAPEADEAGASRAAPTAEPLEPTPSSATPTPVEQNIRTEGYSPWVRLDSYATRPGEGVGFSGFGFSPGEQVRVYLDGDRRTPVAEATADDRGEVSSPAVVQPGERDVGKHSLTVVGQATGTELQVDFEVLEYTPAVELTSYAGRPGALVAFDGIGFAPGEEIRAYRGGGADRIQVSTFQADERGGFRHAGEFRVPADALAGPLPVTLESAVSETVVERTFTVVAPDPWVGLSSYYGPPGTRLTARIEGFGANETVGIFIAGSEERLATAETDILGAAAEIGPVAVPEDAGESVAFVARGDLSGVEGSVTFTVAR